MSRDRLFELASLRKQSLNNVGANPIDTVTETNGYINQLSASTSLEDFSRCADILDKAISDIARRADAIAILHTQSLEGSAQGSDIEHRKDVHTNDMNNLIRNIGQDLKQIGLENDKLIAEHPDQVATGDIAIRRGRHGVLLKKYYDQVCRYRDMEREYQKQYRAQMENQMRAINPRASIQEVREAAKDDNVRSSFIHQVADNRHARRVMRRVEEQEQDIKKIEQTVVEINQLFMEMQDMVQRQQTMVDNIENAVENAKEYTKEGVTEVHQAVDIRKRTRKRIIITLIIVVLIIVVIVLIIIFVIIKPQNK
ncbi:hypothetical protein EV182_002539 [Spiromyces aspiralis]|uniref:Uncharacterized protein n=1 Tax=Spiromyces aspiralis TaxID=68401 RepID=A0ACC1HE96_9FUNG|nr:hypothetical protein EV182_002539 [Spiromyces aspiralis]